MVTLLQILTTGKFLQFHWPNYQTFESMATKLIRKYLINLTILYITLNTTE